MFDQHRAIATSIYLCSMIITLILAFTHQKLILILLFIVIQFCAGCWYVLSYIPFGRSMAKNCMQTCLGF
eukprot:UN07952